MPKKTEYTGICVECGAEQPSNYMEKTPFAEPSCKFCGGVVTIVINPTPERIAQFKARMTRKV